MFPNPPSPSDPKVIQVLKAHRASLDAMEADLMTDMGRRWLLIESGLEADISALAQEMARRTAAGETITQQMIWRADRYKIIKAQLADEIRKYNKDYAVDTIAQAQKQYATLGIQAAQDAITANYPSPLSASFNRINVSAVESMIGFAGAGSPLYTLLKNDYGDAVGGLTDALVNGLARGLGPGQIGRDMADGMGMGLDRALLIARTEAARSYRTGSTEQYRQSGVCTGFMRLVKKETACMGCLMLDGEKFKLADELTDHPRGKAELPDSLIYSTSPEALITWDYDGDIVVISTASGKFLPVTPKHPVLTRRGWVEAAFVQKGDDVIGYGGGEWASLVIPDIDHIPTLAKDIPGAFNMVRLGSVPPAAQHLYSNGEDGQVDVVFANRLLWDGLDPSGQEKLREFFFGSRNVGLGFLNTVSNFTKMLVRQFLAARPFMGVGNSGLSFGLAHVLPAQIGGLRSAAPLNAILGQDASDNTAGDVELFCNSLLGYAPIIKSANTGNVRSTKPDFVATIGGNLTTLNDASFGFTPEQPLSLEQIREALLRNMPAGGGSLGAIPGNVIFDSIVNVDRRRFVGHVYSLQTKEQWYVSNGIITHNCMAIPLVEGVNDPDYQKGKDWFLEQSEADQKRIMGPEKWQAWKDNNIPLDRFAQHAHSDVWGSSPRVANLDELLGGVKAPTITPPLAELSTE